MWCLRVASSISCLLAACGDETLLIVQVRTDYEPVADFDAVEVAIADRVVTAAAAPSEPVLSRRIATTTSASIASCSGPRRMTAMHLTAVDWHTESARVS